MVQINLQNDTLSLDKIMTLSPLYENLFKNTCFSNFLSLLLLFLLNKIYVYRLYCDKRYLYDILIFNIKILKY